MPASAFRGCGSRSQANGPIEDLFARLDDTRFNLIVIGQPVPANGVPGLGDRLRILAVPGDAGNDRELARAQIPQPSYYLLRPDGHIGLAGTHLDAAAMTRYLSDRVHLGVIGA